MFKVPSACLCDCMLKNNNGLLPYGAATPRFTKLLLKSDPSGEGPLAREKHIAEGPWMKQLLAMACLARRHAVGIMSRGFEESDDLKSQSFGIKPSAFRTTVSERLVSCTRWLCLMAPCNT